MWEPVDNGVERECEAGLWPTHGSKTDLKR